MAEPVLSPGSVKKRQAVLAYFSGTGGTARVAAAIGAALENRGIAVRRIPMEKNAANADTETVAPGETPFDFLVVVFAVHAFDAPEPVFEWIRDLSEAGKNAVAVSTAVISVSAGGEASINSACRAGCIRALERKGYSVSYERMMMMPCNWLRTTPEQVALWQLKVLPDKADHCAKEIVQGISRRVTPTMSGRIFSLFSCMEKWAAPLFGKDLHARHTCTGCSWCSQHCPRQNITMKNGRPSFGWRCVFCMRCVYGCPANALYSRFHGFVVLKEGFSIKKLEERLSTGTLQPLEILEHDPRYSYAAKYLKNVGR